jgi:hypothetical protein
MIFFKLGIDKNVIQEDNGKLIQVIYENTIHILGKGYLFFIVTLFSCMKSMQSLKVPSFFFPNNAGAPQGDTLGHIYAFFKSSSSYTRNSFNYGVLIL